MYFRRIYYRIWKSWEYKNRPEFVISKGSQYCDYTYIWQFDMYKDHIKVLTEELLLFKNGFIMCTADFLVKLLKIFKPKQVELDEDCSLVLATILPPIFS